MQFLHIARSPAILLASCGITFMYSQAASPLHLKLLLLATKSLGVVQNSNLWIMVHGTSDRRWAGRILDLCIEDQKPGNIIGNTKVVLINEDLVSNCLLCRAPGTQIITSWGVLHHSKQSVLTCTQNYNQSFQFSSLRSAARCSHLTADNSKT